MEPMHLSFGALVAYLNRAIFQMQDHRKASNGTKYSLSDAVLGAFSVFFMQSESFLEYQRPAIPNSKFSGAETPGFSLKSSSVEETRSAGRA